MPHDSVSPAPEAKTLHLDKAVFQQTLDKKLSDLPPLPAVISQIMHTVNDPNTSAEDLNRLITLDQGLSSKILRIVNSAYYGFPKRIGTITHAVIILGFNTVRNLVLGVSAYGMLTEKTKGGGLDRTKFWEHSVATAVAASLVAKNKKLKTRAMVEEAFLAGLLHDIGELFLDAYFPVQYAVTVAYAERAQLPMQQSEQAVLDMDHAMVGKKIAEMWNFPPTLAAAIGAHHGPDPESETFESEATVHVADWMAWQLGYGSSAKAKAPELTEATLAWLNWSQEEVEERMADLREAFTAAQGLLQLTAA